MRKHAAHQIISRIFALVGFAALALTPAIALAQSGKETLAISSVQPTASLKASMERAGKTLSLGRVVEAFDSQLIAQVNATRKFEIVGRSDLKDVVKEQELGQSGNVDAKTGAQAGKLAGAKYLLVTTIDDFEDSTERMEFKELKKVGIKRKIHIGAVAKIYDSTTGKLLESANVRIDRKDDRSDAADLQKNAELTDALLADAVQDTATQVATRVADIIFPVRVLVKRDRQITVNRGEGTGIEPGQVWNVYALGEELVDPDTKESLGREEVLVGKARIVSVAPKTSTAEILEDTGIDKGAILRLPPQTKK
jgi:curli biogenesis system outer membrane secretion channel CsgG